MKAKTIEQLREEFCEIYKMEYIPLMSNILFQYVQHLEQKLIQPEPQRSGLNLEEIDKKVKESINNITKEDFDNWLKKGWARANEPEPQRGSVFEDLFDNNNPIEITSDKKMEVCMNCAETFDINYSGCICTTCFLGGENGTLDAEVFMNGCNIIADASNEDGHDAWTKESVLMLMQLFYKAQSKHSLPIVSEPTVKEPSKGAEDLNQSIETILFSAYLVGEESISTGTNFKSWFERNNVLDSIKKLFHTSSEITYEEVFNQENRDKVKEYILSQLNTPKQVTEDEMVYEIDFIVLNWLKSGNENTTQLSFDIVQYFKGLSLQNKELWIGNIS